jgi:hypothetical protein
MISQDAAAVINVTEATRLARAWQIEESWRHPSKRHSSPNELTQESVTSNSISIPVYSLPFSIIIFTGVEGANGLHQIVWTNILFRSY